MRNQSLSFPFWLSRTVFSAIIMFFETSFLIQNAVGAENVYQHTNMLSLYYILTQYVASSRSNIYRMWQTTDTWLKILIANKSCHLFWDLYSGDCFILLISFLTIRCLSFLLIKGSLHLYSLLSLLDAERSVLFPLTSLFSQLPKDIHTTCAFLVILSPLLQNKTCTCNIS